MSKADHMDLLISCVIGGVLTTVLLITFLCCIKKIIIGLVSCCRCSDKGQEDTSSQANMISAWNGAKSTSTEEIEAGKKLITSSGSLDLEARLDTTTYEDINEELSSPPPYYLFCKDVPAPVHSQSHVGWESNLQVARHENKHHYY